MTTSIKAACACGSFAVTIEFPTSSLPLDRALCLCNSCRSISGSVGTSCLMVPVTPANQAIDLEKFKTTSYQSSEGANRHFCSTCGAHCFVAGSKLGPSWAICTGLWDRTEGIINWTGSKYIESTLDGGISIWLNDIASPDGSKRALKRWTKYDRPGDELTPPEAFRSLPIKDKAISKDDKLTAQCHCGGVKFYITRPNEESKKVEFPFPDLMVPYHSHSADNAEGATWCLRENDTKYLAGTCSCTTCRLASGAELQGWAFVPKCNVFQEDGKLLDYKMGTLKRYESSKGVEREFCGICGATVFWHDDQRPGLIDVSVGVLDPKEGARAENWLWWWTDRVSFAELAVSKDLVGSMVDGLKTWRENGRE